MGPTLYAYVGNDPVSLVDHDGNYPTAIHEQIVDRAFPGLTAQQRQTLKSASYWMDHSATSQMKSHNHEHFMKSRGQNPAAAAAAARSYIQNQSQAAQAIQGERPQNVASLEKDALTAVGNAIHTATDGTSPAHVDANGNPRDWGGIPTSRAEIAAVQQHEVEEAHPTDAQIDSAVSAAQKVFIDTFGDATAKQAITPPRLCATGDQCQ